MGNESGLDNVTPLFRTSLWLAAVAVRPGKKTRKKKKVRTFCRSTLCVLTHDVVSALSKIQKKKKPPSLPPRSPFSSNLEYLTKNKTKKEEEKEKKKKKKTTTKFLNTK